MAGLNAGDGASGGSVCVCVCYDLELFSGDTVRCLSFLPSPADGIKKGFHFIDFVSFDYIPSSTTHKESWNQLSRDDLFPSWFLGDIFTTASIHCCAFFPFSPRLVGGEKWPSSLLLYTYYDYPRIWQALAACF